MKVLELLDEIEEIVDTAAGFPLTGKIMVDAEEILEIVKEIRVELPDEIQQAQWIKDERQRILDEAKREYDTVIRDAQKQAEALIENDDITVKAKRRAEEIMSIAEANLTLRIFRKCLKNLKAHSAALTPRLPLTEKKLRIWRLKCRTKTFN